jgi:hypothetical protein
MDVASIPWARAPCGAAGRLGTCTEFAASAAGALSATIPSDNAKTNIARLDLSTVMTRLHPRGARGAWQMNRASIPSSCFEIAPFGVSVRQNYVSAVIFITRRLGNLPCQRWSWCRLRLWVGHSRRFARCPLLPRKRTSAERIGMSAKGHFRTHAVQHYLAGYSSNRSNGWSIRKRVVQARRSSASVFPSS